MKSMKGKDSIEWILIAKGITIVLVVIGHFHPESSPYYWSSIRRIIYTFHMPLFFILSGYLYTHGKYSYTDLIKHKIKRLLYPFVTIAAVFFIIKYIAGSFVKLDQPVNINSIYALLTDPVASYMPLLWFVYALFLIFAIYPLGRLFLNNQLILIILLIINSFFGNDYLVLGNTLFNMPFFAVGVILKESVKVSKMTISSDLRHIFFSLLTFAILYTIETTENVHIYLISFILGVMGSLFVINLSHAIANITSIDLKGILMQVGYYSMTIYLLHTLFESTVRIGSFYLLKDIHVPFLLIAFIAIICGIVFPLILEKVIFRKYWVTNKYVLGLS